MNMNNKNMQDINTSETREICFEVQAPLFYVPTFNTKKDFH